MSDSRIWLSPPHMGGAELNFVQEAFATNWVSPAGPHIIAFENELVQYAGVGYCAALNSGTSAIHLALILLGVGEGDEVICSTFTFSGSCNPIAYQKATPVFVDSEALTWNMDPVLLEEAIADRIKKTGKKPKAIILVHLYGMPAQIHELMAIANRHEIPVIEDAAEALGSSVGGTRLGGFGQMGVFSFNGNKIITTSGGGALVSKRADWISDARFLATQARDPAPHYEHSKIGYNYRLSNICAGIGRGQLVVLDDWITRRRTNFESYRNMLSDMPDVSFLAEPEGYFANRWLTTITFDAETGQGVLREKVRLAMDRVFIETRPLWKPMHRQPVFNKYPCYLNGISEELFDRGLCLPSGSNLSEKDRIRVVEILRKCLKSK